MKQAPQVDITLVSANDEGRREERRGLCFMEEVER